jgi:hypothetical protein
MPRVVRASLWLLIAGYLVGLAVTPFDPRPRPRIPDTTTLITAIVLGIAIVWLIVFFALRTYQGRNWARWVQLTTLVAATPSFIRDTSAQFGIAPAVGSIHVLLFITGAVSVALLFTPTANLWYRQLSTERATA